MADPNPYVVMRWHVAKVGGVTKDFEKKLALPLEYDPKHPWRVVDHDGTANVPAGHYEHVTEDETGVWVYARK